MIRDLEPFGQHGSDFSTYTHLVTIINKSRILRKPHCFFINVDVCRVSEGSPWKSGPTLSTRGLTRERVEFEGVPMRTGLWVPPNPNLKDALLTVRKLQGTVAQTCNLSIGEAG